MSSFNALYNPTMDYFAVLGVHQGACEQSVKLAYRKMARRYHPDVSKIVDAKARFQEIAEAYEVLSKHRQAYCRDFEQARLRKRAFAQPKTKPSHKPRESRDTAEAASQAQDEPYARQAARRTPKPLDGKNRLITYPLTLRYAIRLLKLGVFYVPGLKLNMKFTRQAFEGKTFRISGKGYSGLFGGKAGDYLVRFSINIDSLRYQLNGADIYATFIVAKSQLTPGNQLNLHAPSGHFSLQVPYDYQPEQLIKVPDMGLPADQQQRAGHLYARLLTSG
jgi:curved DNA-binding protein